MKKFILFLLLLAACLGIFFLVRPAKAPFLHEYTLTPPEGIVLQKDSKTGNATLLRDGQVIGGILNCPYSRKVLKAAKSNPIHSVSFNQEGNFEAILSTLEAAGAPGIGKFDYMMESSLYADCELWSGNLESEYQQYLYLFEDGILTLWFDLTLAGAETARSIATGFSVDRAFL